MRSLESKIPLHLPRPATNQTLSHKSIILCLALNSDDLWRYEMGNFMRYQFVKIKTLTFFGNEAIF